MYKINKITPYQYFLSATLLWVTNVGDFSIRMTISGDKLNVTISTNKLCKFLMAYFNNSLRMFEKSVKLKCCSDSMFSVELTLLPTINKIYKS